MNWNYGIGWRNDIKTLALFHNDPACLIPAKLDGFEVEILRLDLGLTEQYTCSTCGRPLEEQPT